MWVRSRPGRTRAVRASHWTPKFDTRDKNEKVTGQRGAAFFKLGSLPTVGLFIDCLFRHPCPPTATPVHHLRVAHLHFHVSARLQLLLSWLKSQDAHVALLTMAPG